MNLVPIAKLSSYYKRIDWWFVVGKANIRVADSISR